MMTTDDNNINICIALKQWIFPLKITAKYHQNKQPLIKNKTVQK